MAEVLPFRGYRYNDELIKNMADVVAPPYDVISPQAQQQLYQRHPQNVIRLILGMRTENDTDENNVYSRARATLRKWLDERILIQDAQTSFYLTQVDFSVGNQKISRFGLLGRVGIRPFSDGVILPHEHTFSKVKSERLRLMKTTNSNLCPIFGLYTDENREMHDLLSKLSRNHQAVFELVDDNGSCHRLWCLNETAIHDRICSFFSSKKIYIADGHHRYETALNYRDWLITENNDIPASHPANYVMMSMSSMQDPGMVILPAHRAVREASRRDLTHLLDTVSEYFDVIRIGSEQRLVGNLDIVMGTLERNAHRNAIGLLMQNPYALQVLVLKPDVMDQLFGAEIASPLRSLDVTVLTHLLMMRLMGLSQTDLDDQEKIIYSTNAEEAATMVERGEVDVAFLLNPTKIEQVQHVAEFGLTMPRKSTYFYPKVISGQVFNILE